MYRQFGKTPGQTCGTCSNFVSGRYHTRTLRKCSVYGLTHSEASDWAKRWEACGCYNKEWTGGEIIQLVRARQTRDDPRIECEGQERMWEEE